MKRVNSSNKTSGHSKFNYRSLVAGLFIAGGVFQLVTPALAAPAADTTISNTATATYTDPSNPSTPITAQSNTVTITVAEVAGITVVSANTPTNLQPGSTVPYDFRITNAGNDPTRFVVPNVVTVSGTGGGTQSGNLLISYDGTTYTDITTLPGYNATTKELTTNGVAANGTILVRAQILVPANAAGGSTITVRLGNTGGTDLQNQSFNASGNNTDVYTKDDNTLTTPAGEAATTSPVGGEKEASATLSGTVGNIASVLNGPLNTPGATGPDTTTNTDFTNKAVAPTNSTPGATNNDPSVVTFTNTLQNTGNTTTTFLIQPNTLLPNTLPTTGTTTITIAPTGGTAGTFSWNGTSWSTITPASVSIAAGAQVNYTVAVDLPLGTKLSTDLKTIGDLTSAQGGYGVPIVAFVDQGTAGLDANDPQNITINRTYLGYVTMYKEAQIYNPDGTIGTPIVSFTSDPAALTGKLTTTGQVIEYRISYKNISENAGTTGSIGLSAASFTITEDGTAGTNNWGTTTTHVSATDARAGASVTTIGTPITGYTDTVGTLQPGDTGALNIQRKLN